MQPAEQKNPTPRPLSTRSVNILAKFGVKSTEQLKDFDPKRLEYTKGAGIKTIQEITAFRESIFGKFVPKNPTKEELNEINPDAVFATEDLDAALVGYVVGGPSTKHVAAYDLQKCIKIIAKRDDMDYQQALEYLENLFSPNDNTPVFVNFPDAGT